MTENTNTKPIVGTAKMWTLDSVRALAGQGEAGQKGAAKMREAALAERKVVEKRDGQATVMAALTTYVNLKTGVIADGRGAHVMSKGDYAAALGRTGSLVSRWITLGYAAVDCGVDVQSRTWKLLSSDGGADKKPVSALIKRHTVKAEDGTYGTVATVAEIDTALAEFFDADGKPKTAPTGGAGQPRSAGGTTPSAPEGDTTDTGKPVDVSAEAARMAVALLDVVKTAGPDGLRRSEASVVRKAIADILAAMGPDVATPKTVAAKTAAKKTAAA